MLAWVKKTLFRLLLLFSAIVAVLWGRSYCSVDVASLDWSYVLPQSLKLISTAGGLHIDYTHLRPLNGLRRTSVLIWNVFDDTTLERELLAASRTDYFGMRTEWQVRTPLQPLPGWPPGRPPIYQSRTTPLKLISFPWWPIFLLLFAWPALKLLDVVRGRGWVRGPSASRWILRRPGLVMVLLTLLLSLAWLRSGWRSDQFQLSGSARTYEFGLADGQMLALMPLQRSYVGYDAGSHPSLRYLLANAEGVRQFDWIIAPFQFDRYGLPRILFPFWLLTLGTASLAAWLLWPRRWKAYPPGHCAQCGYDLRATLGRCPECGLAKGASLPHATPAWRMVSSALLLLSIGLSFATALLVLAWLRNTHHATIFVRIQDRLIIELLLDKGKLIGRHWPMQYSRANGVTDFLVLPFWIAPVLLALLSALAFWFSRHLARPKETSAIPASHLKASAPR